MTHPRQLPPSQHMPAQHSPTQHARKRSPLPWLIFAVLVVVAGIVLVPKLLPGDDSGDTGAQPVAAAEPDPLLLAVQKCDPDKRDVKLSDSNRRLTVNGAPEKSADGLTETGLACVFEVLQVPGALVDRMKGSTEEDGQLQGDWPGFTITWTNSDSKGLNMTVTRSS